MKPLSNTQRPRVLFAGLPALQLDPEGYPIVPAYRLVDAEGIVVQVVFWGRYCLRWHLHGAGDGTPGAGNGHRVAHCHSQQSQYTSRPPCGYILDDIGTITPAERDWQYPSQG